MTRLVRLGATVGIVVGAFAAVAGCSSDDTSDSTSIVVSTGTVVDGTDGTGTAPGGGATTTVPSRAYTVQQGDSLYGIADDFCTDPASIATFNGWTDGLQHLLRPGDTIAIPGTGCDQPTDPPITTTTLPANEYVADYLTNHVVADPFDTATIDRVSWGPLCYDAYWNAQYFAVSGLPKAELMTSLDALPGTVPASIVQQIDRWVPFSTHWYPVYTDVVGRLQAQYPEYEDHHAYVMALLTDPEYVALLDAYQSVGGEQFAAKYWVTDVCEQYERTTSTTP